MACETRVPVPMPEHLYIAGVLAARCYEVPHERWVRINVKEISSRHIHTLTAWLARAQAWVEDKKGGDE